jgi:hypothetical protein
LRKECKEKKKKKRKRKSAEGFFSQGLSRTHLAGCD